MSIVSILLLAILLSIVFHFIGIYSGAKKFVWIAIALMWIAGINLATSEIKKSGYKEIERMQGKYKQTDKLIKEAMPSISLYEMLSIKKNFDENERINNDHTF
jgi:hypothetical protein